MWIFLPALISLVLAAASDEAPEEERKRAIESAPRLPQLYDPDEQNVLFWLSQADPKAARYAAAKLIERDIWIFPEKFRDYARRAINRFLKARGSQMKGLVQMHRDLCGIKVAAKIEALERGNDVSVNPEGYYRLEAPGLEIADALRNLINAERYRSDRDRLYGEVFESVLNGRTSELRVQEDINYEEERNLEAGNMTSFVLGQRWPLSSDIMSQAATLPHDLAVVLDWMLEQNRTDTSMEDVIAAKSLADDLGIDFSDPANRLLVTMLVLSKRG